MPTRLVPRIKRKIEIQVQQVFLLVTSDFDVKKITKQLLPASIYKTGL